MAQSAANWVDHVLPCVPLRQFVLTLPFELRARIAYDRALLGRIARLFADCVLGFYRRTLRDRYGLERAESGAITVVQRVNSDLRLNPHLHTLGLDGAFVEDAGGELVFHCLPSLSNADVAALLSTIRRRVLALLERKGVIESAAEPSLADDGFAEREPEVAALATAAATGNSPAGPERRQRRPVALPDAERDRSVSCLSAREGGFSLHAATTAPAEDARARETLCKYVLRPPVAQERVALLPDGLVRILLKRPFSDGTVAVDLDPLSLLCRLAASVPPPRAHVVRYGGVLSAAHRWRSRVVPPPPPDDPSTKDEHSHAKPPARPSHRSRYRPWRELLKRTFAIDVEKCGLCGASMILRALLIDAESVAGFLTRIGEDPNPPPVSPARAPPYFKAPALRRMLGELELETQMDLFSA